MAIQLLASIKVQCIHSEKYFPKNITKGQWYNVVGVNSWGYWKEDKDDQTKKKYETVIKYLIINDEMKMIAVAAHNCNVINLDEKIEPEKA